MASGHIPIIGEDGGIGEMPEDNTGDVPNGNKGQDASENQLDTTELLARINDLEKQLGQVTSEAAQRRREKKQAEEAAAKEREKLLAEQGQWQKLAEEKERQLTTLQGAQEQLDSLLENLRVNNEKRVAQVPEHMRSLLEAPMRDMSPTAFLQFLDENWPKLTTANLTRTDAGAGGGRDKPKLPPLTDGERRRLQQMGVSEEKYLREKARIMESLND